MEFHGAHFIQPIRSPVTDGGDLANHMIAVVAGDWSSVAHVMRGIKLIGFSVLYECGWWLRMLSGCWSCDGGCWDVIGCWSCDGGCWDMTGCWLVM